MVNKYTARGKHGVAPGDVLAENDGREAAVPAPPPPRPNLINILEEIRRPSITMRPPPRQQAQDPVTRNLTDEGANGHSSVSLCRGNHQRLVCHWSLRDSNNTNQSWRVNMVDYIDNEEARRQHQRCLERRPADLRQMLAERVYDDLLDRYHEQVGRRGATGITPPVFRRTHEELTPLVNRRLNSLSSTGRSIDTVPASRGTAPPRSARDAQEEKEERERKIEAFENKMKREKEELDKVNANRAKRLEARRIANEAKRKEEEEARRIAAEAALENSGTESTRSLSYSLSPAAGARVKTPKKTVQDSKKSATKSAGGETTVRTRAKAARPIIESDTSSDSSNSTDYSDSVKPPQPSKEDIEALKSVEEPPATPAKKTPAKSTEKAPAESTEKTPAESTEKTPAKPTEEAPTKPTRSEEPTTSVKSTETAPAKPDPKASGATKKLSLVEFAARKKAAQAAAKAAAEAAAKAAAEASTATATADAEAEATVDTTAETQETQEPRGSIKETEVKATTTTRQNSPGGEIIERHEAHEISTETRTHSTPPPPSPEHQSKDTADVETPSSQPPSPGSPGKRKRSAAEEEPIPDSDARIQRSNAPSPQGDDPSPRKKSKTVTPPESPPPPPSVLPPSPSYFTSKKRKMVLAEEEGEVTSTGPGGTRAKRARSDDGKDGEASTPSAPTEEKSADAEAEEPTDADIEALFHNDSEENGSPGRSVLTAGDEASSSPAQTGEDPAGTEKSADSGNEADGEASDS